MPSLRSADENAAILRRLEALRPDSTRLWGRMDPAQMCAHCSNPLDMAAGKLRLERMFLGKLIGGFAKKRFVVGDAEFGKGAPTHPKLKVADPREFAAEKAALAERIRDYAETGALTTDPHVFFGPLAPGEWDRLMWKHLDHHLRQFGL